MLPGRIEIRHRSEHEPSMLQTRMRNHKIRIVDDPLPVKENVQVERARALAIVFITTKGPFNFPADHEQALGRHVGLHLHHTVEEPAFAGMGMIRDRLRLIQGRHGDDFGMREQTEQRDGAIAEVQPIPDVRPEPDEDGLAHVR